MQKNPPNAMQILVMERVMKRCREEEKSFFDKTAAQYKDDPIFDWLSGSPGAGKSTCIKMMHEVFEECLGWQHGV